MKINFKKFGHLVLQVAPLVLANVKGGDKLAPFVPVITHAITEAEAIPGASGEQKKAHVLNSVADAVTVLNATGKVALDPAEVQSIASDGIDLTVKIVKDVHQLQPEAGG